MTPLSALAENFIPQKTSRKPPTPQMPTDNELDRSFARTGSGKIETPQDIIEIDRATVGAASPTEIEKPVAVADVAGASGPAVTGAGGPVRSRNAVPGSYRCCRSQWPGSNRSRWPVRNQNAIPVSY